jgi:1-acyl-sn-glycerol-3-phosphate acyltransferase
MLYYLLKPIALFLCKIFFRIEVKGKENIPKKGGFILASNHLSNLDPVILGVACPRKLNFMAKDELFKIPIFSNFIRCLGAFPVKRETVSHSTFKEVFKRLKQQKPIVIFPEGTRNPKGERIIPKAGIGFIIKYVSVPVVPAYIQGTDEALGPHAKFIKPVKISVYFGKQIIIDDRNLSNNYIEIATRIMDSIRKIREDFKFN